MQDAAADPGPEPVTAVLCLGGARAVIGAPAGIGGAAAVAETGDEAYRRIRLEMRGSDEDVRQTWRDTIRHLPPAFRERWLDTQEARSALGAKRVKDLLKALRAQERAISETIPGGAWLEAYQTESIRMPTPLMSLSRAELRFGSAGKPRRRYTPSPAVGLEDFIDLQDPDRALFYRHPASPSALAIRHIGFYGRNDSRPIKKAGGRGR